MNKRTAVFSVFALLAGSQILRGQAYPLVIPQIGAWVNAQGVPFAGGKLCTYVSNTTTPAPTYTDSTGSTPNTNPVILDSAGRASLWGGTTLYTLTLLIGGDGTCATGTPVWTQNNVGASFSIGGTAGYVQYSVGGGLTGGNPNFFYTVSTQALTVQGTSNSAEALNVLNGYIFTTGGLDVEGVPGTTPLNFNVIQAPFGGMLAQSFTAKYYVQSGQYSGPLASGPPISIADTFNPGAISYSVAGACEAVFDGSTWACFGSGGGGGGSPGGVTGSVQINSGTSFGGDANLIYTLGGNLVMTGTGAITSVGGFSSSSTATNGIQIPAGGVSSKWLIASDSLFLLEEAAPAAPSSGQGKIYVDSTLHTPLFADSAVAMGAFQPMALTAAASSFTNGDCVDVAVASGFVKFQDAGVTCNGSGGSGTITPSPQTEIPYYSAAGTAATLTGAANLQWNNSTSQLSVFTSTDTVAAITASVGYIQSSGGFTTACSSIPCLTQAIQAPNGGISGKELIATDSVFWSACTGTAPGVSGPGQFKLYCDTGSGGLKFSYNTSTFAVFGGGGASQWTTSGSSIYNNNAGSVGIGTTSPLPGVSLDAALGTCASGPCWPALLRNSGNYGVYIGGQVNTGGGASAIVSLQAALVGSTYNQDLALQNQGGHLLVGTSTDDGSGFEVQVTGTTESTVGFYSGNTPNNTINIPNGGVSAKELVTTDSLFWGACTGTTSCSVWWRPIQALLQFDDGRFAVLL